MGQLFEHWDSGPDEELVEKGRAEERRNTEAEKKRADEAEDRADKAESRADKAEARVKELEALLAADSQVYELQINYAFTETA